MSNSASQSRVRLSVPVTARLAAVSGTAVAGVAGGVVVRRIVAVGPTGRAGGVVVDVTGAGVTTVETVDVLFASTGSGVEEVTVAVSGPVKPGAGA